MKWRRHLASVGKMINAQKFCSEKLELTNHLKGLGVNERIIFKWLLEKLDVTEWIGLK
jgi:hypothetical protein